MSASALAGLWRTARPIVRLIGRWMLRRIRRGGAKRLATRMKKRALGYQTRRLNAAKRRGDTFWIRFRTRQIKRWLLAVEWLKANGKQLNGLAATGLDSLARKAGIPLTHPNEGRV